MSGPTASTRGEIARMIAQAETAGAGHLAGILAPAMRGELIHHRADPGHGAAAVLPHGQAGPPRGVRRGR